MPSDHEKQPVPQNIRGAATAAVLNDEELISHETESDR